MKKSKGYVTECVIISRAGSDSSDALFESKKDGTIIPHLNGYAIIPKEKYYTMKAVCDSLKEVSDILGGLREVARKDA